MDSDLLCELQLRDPRETPDVQLRNFRCHACMSVSGCCVSSVGYTHCLCPSPSHARCSPQEKVRLRRVSAALCERLEVSLASLSLALLPPTIETLHKARVDRGRFHSFSQTHSHSLFPEMKSFLLLFVLSAASTALSAGLECRSKTSAVTNARKTIPKPKQASLKAANEGQHTCLPLTSTYVTPETPPAIDYDASTNRLIYTPSDNGDQLPDYSYSGYHKSNIALPTSDSIKDLVTLSPSGGNDTAQIVDALEQIAAMPVDGRGIRGALLLKAGDWKVTGPIEVRFSGVIIRGEGSGLDGTVIHDSSPFPFCQAYPCDSLTFLDRNRPER